MTNDPNNQSGQSDLRKLLQQGAETAQSRVSTVSQSAQTAAQNYRQKQAKNPRVKNGIKKAKAIGKGAVSIAIPLVKTFAIAAAVGIALNVTLGIVADTTLLSETFAQSASYIGGAAAAFAALIKETGHNPANGEKAGLKNVGKNMIIGTAVCAATAGFVDFGIGAAMYTGYLSGQGISYLYNKRAASKSQPSRKPFKAGSHTAATNNPILSGNATGAPSKGMFAKSQVAQQQRPAAGPQIKR